MSYPVYTVYSGDVLPIFFDSFDGGTGASITMTGLAVTDIEIYKDGSATQRASDAGYTLLDTDGIDFDGITGIHGFSIDTGDNTDAGFYSVGSWFHVVVSSVTIDGQTVNFVAAAFRIVAAEAVAGVPVVDVKAISGDATAADNCEADYDGTGYAGGTIVKAADVTKIAGAVVATGTAQLGVNVVNWKGSAANVFTADYTATEKAAIDLLDDADGGIADIHTVVNDLHTDVATVAGYLDTEIAAILADTNELQTDLVNGGRLDLLIDAIKAKTDSLTFTISNKIDANVYTWNGTAVHAPGTAGVPIVDIHDASSVTIGTVTNLTNAATNGDLTATMKSSVTTAATASTPALSAAGVDAIWDEVASGHAVAGSFGKYLDSDISANTDHITADYTATEKSAIDLLDDVSGGLSDIHADVATVAGYLDTEIAAILADTNELQTDWVNGGRLDLILDGIETHVHTTDGHITADYTATEKAAIDLLDDASGGLADIHTDIGTIAGYLDTEIAAILADTNELQTDWTNGGRLDLLLDAIPTATANADALLKRDWTSVTGEAARSCLNAFRILRNARSVSGFTLSVKKEDDLTDAWTASVSTSASAETILGVDPS